jgi:hypothetical protein
MQRRKLIFRYFLLFDKLLRGISTILLCNRAHIFQDLLSQGLLSQFSVLIYFLIRKVPDRDIPACDSFCGPSKKIKTDTKL